MGDNSENKDSMYTLEFICLSLLIIYGLFFIYGRYRNQMIVNCVYLQIKDILQLNFSKVDEEFRKDSESGYSLYSTGRRHCAGMLIKLQLKQRHDMIGYGLNMIQQSIDLIHIEVPMLKNSMDPFVFAILRKNDYHAIEDNPDIGDFCRHVPLELLPKEVSCYTDSDDVLAAFLESKLLQELESCWDDIKMVHFTDSSTHSMLGNAKNYRKSLKFVLRLPFPINWAHLRKQIELIMKFIDEVGEFHLSQQAKDRAEVARISMVKQGLKAKEQ